MVRFKFIINKFALGKNSIVKWDYAKSFLNNKIRYSEVFVSTGKEAVYQAKIASKDYDVVVACGGDGTIRDVLTGIIGSKASLGIVPFGTSNDFAKSKGIINVECAIKSLIRKKEMSIDIGKVKLDKLVLYFNSTSGIGFDAYMLRLNEYKPFKKLKTLFGRFSYIFAALFLSLYYTPVKTKLIFNDAKTYSMCLFELNANFVKSMSGLKVTPIANSTNGFFDIFLFRKIFWPKMLLGFIWYSLISKKIPFREADYISNDPKMNIYGLTEIKKFSVLNDNHLQLNGDYIGKGKAEFEIMPKAIKIIIP